MITNMIMVMIILMIMVNDAMTTKMLIMIMVNDIY